MSKDTLNIETLLQAGMMQAHAMLVLLDAAQQTGGGMDNTWMPIGREMDTGYGKTIIEGTFYRKYYT